MTRKFTLLVYFSILLFSAALAQPRLDTLNWRSPVGIPIKLSGNFGELRSTHFHAGIDIKTNGKIGYRLYAVQDGYISRIKVRTGGYGKAIYINHPDGYTSVYAHMHSFNIQIDKYVKEAQYAQESFEVDLYPKQGELPVIKGDVLGLSGNSGSSMGPHLHFEIRRTKDSNPLNGLFLGYNIKDTIAPKMYTLFAYPLNDTSRINGSSEKQSFNLIKSKSEYKINEVIKVHGQVGFGIKVNDFLNNSYNRCGTYQIDMTINDSLWFRKKLDEISFAESGYIKSYVDYEESVTNKNRLHKLYKEPNNRLSIYEHLADNGFINSDSLPYKSSISITAFDANDNTSHLQFSILKDTNKYSAINHSGVLALWNEKFKIDTLGFGVEIPAKALYNNSYISFSTDSSLDNRLASIKYCLGNKSIPLHRSYQLEIPIDTAIKPELKDKLTIVSLDEEMKLNAIGGKIEDNVIKTKVRSFETFALALDTVPPEIKGLGPLAKSFDFSQSQYIDFIIQDTLSGIKEYRGTIDGQWALFEYDAKNDLIRFDFNDLPKQTDSFVLELFVVDNCGNESYFQEVCYRTKP